MGETLQDTRYLYWFCEEIYLFFIYFGNVTTVRHEASPRYCNMSLHQDFNLACEGSQYFATPPLVSPGNDISGTSTDIPYR